MDIFPLILIQSYQACVADIHEAHFMFTAKAFEDKSNPMSAINSDTQTEIKSALGNQSYVDWDYFQYGFKMWVALRCIKIPLLTSRKVLPVIASLWNRSKNGSDVATGMIRSA